MEFKVCLDQFEGPLDLMLHLVRTSRLDLFELNLDVLASQYVDYIRLALDSGLDVSSEYLVEFTSLMEYKSKKLLPRNTEVQEDTWQEDPAAVLAARLQEYERCRQEAARLQTLLEERNRRLDRSAASLIDEWMKAPSESAPLSMPAGELAKAMLRVIRRSQILKPYETSVEIREMSVEERMEQVIDLPVFKEDPIRFEKLLDDADTLRMAVVTFLAILELIHQGRLSSWCDGEDEIWIQKTKNP